MFRVTRVGTFQNIAIVLFIFLLYWLNWPDYFHHVLNTQMAWVIGILRFETGDHVQWCSCLLDDSLYYDDTNIAPGKQYIAMMGTNFVYQYFYGPLFNHYRWRNNHCSIDLQRSLVLLATMCIDTFDILCVLQYPNKEFVSEVVLLEEGRWGRNNVIIT